jgi:NCS1 family nucleobase:cation symporter-1
MTSVATSPTDRHYGAKVAAVEPGGAEPIPLAERHGRPVQLLWTWTSPNMEFATVFVGVICVLFFGLTFWQALFAIALGSGLGAISHSVLSSWGPDSGGCQMVLSRRAFGFRGNFLPAGLNSLTAGIGWFAVNSVSGALALAALTGLNRYLCLVVVVAIMLVIAYFGHNLIQLFERFAFPVLAVIFVAGAVLILAKSQPGAPAEPVPGGFWIALGATFGYAAGWNPYAADYTRYLPPGTGRWAGIFAGIGLFASCLLLESVGAAAVTAVGGATWDFVDPVSSYTGLLPAWLEELTLLAICLGAIAANALNVYSSALSFTAMGIHLPTRSSRAAMAVVMGTAGLVVAAIGLDNIDSYEAFLLVIAYWIGPWLGVVFADRVFRRTRPGETVTSDRGYRNRAGFLAMLIAAAASIWLFSNQATYLGVVPRAFPGVGDLTFEVGFVLAVVLYAVLRRPLAGPITVGRPAAERLPQQSSPAEQ